MGNSMAAFFCAFGGARVVKGVAAVLLRLARDRGGRAVEQTKGAVPWQINSACFLQSPLCRYFGKESAP